MKIGERAALREELLRYEFDITPSLRMESTAEREAMRREMEKERRDEEGSTTRVASAAGRTRTLPSDVYYALTTKPGSHRQRPREKVQR